VRRIVASLVTIAFTLGFGAGCQRPDEVSFHATEVGDTPIARDFDLVDAAGRHLRLADFRGKVVLIFFGYTHCPDACPTALARAAQVMRLLGKDAGRLQVLFVTLDPERDTPDILRDYPRVFHPSFLGLAPPTGQTDEVARAFQVVFRKHPGSTPDDYTIDHSVFSYAYDPTGKPRLLIGHEASATEVADDLHKLLAGS
jgi:protein SCO1